jgi:hypothetical protein
MPDAKEKLLTNKNQLRNHVFNGNFIIPTNVFSTFNVESGMQ